MKNNEHVEPLLSAYLDGELSADQREMVAQALESSTEMRRELDELRVTRNLIRGLPRRALGESLADPVVRRAERETLLASSAEAPKRVHWSRWAIAASAAAAGVLAVVFLRPQHGALQVAEGPKPPSSGLSTPAVASRPHAEAAPAATPPPAAPPALADADTDAVSRSKGPAPAADAEAATTRREFKAGGGSVAKMRTAGKPAVEDNGSAAPPGPLADDRRPGKGRRIEKTESTDRKGKEAVGAKAGEAGVRLMYAQNSDVNPAEVVTALDNNGSGQITCVVGNRAEGLKKIQSVLTRNRIAMQASPAGGQQGRAAPARAADAKADDAVFVDATADRIENTVAELREDANFLEVEVAAPAPLALMDALQQRTTTQLNVAAEQRAGSERRRLERAEKDLGVEQKEAMLGKVTQPSTSGEGLGRRARAGASTVQPAAPAAAAPRSQSGAKQADQTVQSDKAPAAQRGVPPLQRGTTAIDEQQERLGQVAAQNTFFYLQVPRSSAGPVKKLDQAKSLNGASTDLANSPPADAGVKLHESARFRQTAPSNAAAERSLQVLFLIREADPAQKPQAGPAKSSPQKPPSPE